jgi:hypothetical protein
VWKNSKQFLSQSVINLSRNIPRTCAILKSIKNVTYSGFITKSIKNYTSDLSRLIFLPRSRLSFLLKKEKHLFYFDWKKRRLSGKQIIKSVYVYKSHDKKYCTVQKKIVQLSFVQYSLADCTVQFIRNTN